MDTTPARRKKTMNAAKQNRMMSVYNGFRGDATVNGILSRIPAELKDALTGAQLGHVMNAINQAYHDGKAAAGAWSDCELIGCGEKTLPLAVYQKVKTESLHTTRFVKNASPVAGQKYVLRDGKYVRVERDDVRPGEETYVEDVVSSTVVSYDGKEVARHPGIL